MGVRPLKKNLSAESSYGNVRKSHIHTLKTKSGKLRSDRSADAASLPPTDWGNSTGVMGRCELDAFFC